MFDCINEMASIKFYAVITNICFVKVNKRCLINSTYTILNSIVVTLFLSLDNIHI